jgi:hypothetical protein
VPAVTTNLFATSPHLLFSTSQNNPVIASQSLVPHAQLPELTEEPSETEHMVLVLQVLSEAKQNKPLEEVQLLVPHAQLPELTEEPSETEHMVLVLQVLSEAKQNKPLEAVQSLVPHAQLSELTALPFVMVQLFNRGLEQILKPVPPSLPSDSHAIESPLPTTTSLGPVVPQYLVPFTVKKSKSHEESASTSKCKTFSFPAEFTATVHVLLLSYVLG